MRFKSITGFGLWIALCFSVPLSAQDVDVIIQKYIDALGGRENLSKIESVVKEGTIGSGNAKINVRCFQKEQQGYKQVIAVGGTRNFTIVTPNEAWEYTPISGETQVRSMPANERKTLQYLLEAKGLLYDYKRSGLKVKEDGRIVFEEKEFLRLRCVDTLSNEFILLLDPTNYLLERMITRVNQHGQWRETMTGFADYRKVDGVMIPFSVMLPIGWVHFEKIELNVSIDEREFMPFKNQ